MEYNDFMLDLGWRLQRDIKLNSKYNKENLRYYMVLLYMIELYANAPLFRYEHLQDRLHVIGLLKDILVRFDNINVGLSNVINKYYKYV